MASDVRRDDADGAVGITREMRAAGETRKTWIKPLKTLVLEVRAWTASSEAAPAKPTINKFRVIRPHFSLSGPPPNR